MAESKLQSLVEIFNQKFFRIPDFQRGYSWGEEELDDFWQDIENIKQNKSYYIGLLTVESIKKNTIENSEKWQDDLWMFDKGFKAYYIIDGQQRLATIIILLKVLLDRFSDKEGINFQLKNYWTDKFLYQQYGNYKSYVFGYEKDDPSDEYFKTKILNQTSLSSAQVPEQTLYTTNLKNAKDFFEKKIKKLSKEELQNIFRKIVNSLKFNLYEIDDELDVFITFETMNNRGKDLSDLELLKNRLIYLSTLLSENDNDKNRLRKDINDAWKTIYEYLGKNKDDPLDDDEFLNNHWIMYFKYERGEAKAYAKFLLDKHFTMRNIVNGKVSIHEIKNYVESISKSVKQWYYLFNPDLSDYSADIKEWLRKLNRLGFGAFAPMLLSAMVKDCDENKVLEIIKIAERFIFLVFHLADRPSHTKNNDFYRLANDFHYDREDIDKIISEIKHLTDGEDENYYYGWYHYDKFKEQIDDLFKRRDGYYSWSGLHYFLYEYEMDLQNKAKGVPKIKWEEINNESIEHIYPREATEICWKKSFNGLSSKKKSAYLNSLGNLLLLSQSKNSEFQNDCFNVKKKHKNKNGNDIGYFNGSYSEIEVSQYDDWIHESILGRGLRMLKFLEIRWNIKLGNDDEKKQLLYLNFDE